MKQIEMAGLPVKTKDELMLWRIERFNQPTTDIQIELLDSNTLLKEAHRHDMSLNELICYILEERIKFDESDKGKKKVKKKLITDKKLKRRLVEKSPT